MSVRSTCLIALLCLAPTLSLSEAPAQSQADLLARLTAAHDATDLTDPTLKPWHMVATFDLLDPKGTVTEHGTFEEWWASPTRWKTTISSPSYTAADTQDGDKLYRTTSVDAPPLSAQLLRAQLESPAPDREDTQNTHPIFQRKILAKVPLECIMLPPEFGKDIPPFGLYATYCFDPGSPNLRITYNFGTETIIRNRIGHFQGKTVALDLAVAENGIVTEKIHIDQLATFDLSSVNFDPTPDQQLALSSHPAIMAAGVLAGRKIGGQQPIYPAVAKQSHTSGRVVLHAIIGRDGRIYRLTPISSPDSSLTTASVAAVRTWTYEPYLLNGEPTEIETTITVNFNFRP